ncbi:MAG: TRAP transporter permease, partial [Desulfobacteraceae bacterium]
MSETEIKGKDEGLELARRMAEEEEGIGRRPRGLERYVIPTIAVAWSLFQLSIASWLILDSTFIRAIHLGFALLIVFLNYPLFKKQRFGLKFLSATDRIPIFDYLLAIVACLSALYIAIDYAGMTARYGAPITRDIVIGMLLVVVLLEASRRVIGPALPIIAIFFILYSFF